MRNNGLIIFYYRYVRFDLFLFCHKIWLLISGNAFIRGVQYQTIGQGKGVGECIGKMQNVYSSLCDK